MYLMIDIRVGYARTGEDVPRFCSDAIDESISSLFFHDFQARFFWLVDSFVNHLRAYFQTCSKIVAKGLRVSFHARAGMIHFFTIVTSKSFFMQTLLHLGV